MSERVAIVGSRDYPDLEEVAVYVRTLPAGTVVVSGGARGVDSHAEGEARRLGLDVESWRVSQDALTSLYTVVVHRWQDGRKDTFSPRGKGFLSFGGAAWWRNGKIVETSDHIEVWWDGESLGTRGVIILSEKTGKLGTVHRPKVSR